jgi:glutathione synthase/RimK-type ligase-like ATP-grasp enzyme
VPSRRKAGLIINWGIGHVPWLYSTSQAINHPNYVKVAANKLSTFDVLNDASIDIPSYTTAKEVALEWIRGGFKVMCRTLLSASAGRGIVVAKEEEAIIDAPLYVKYVEKRYEFRVHVVFNNVVKIQQKRRLSSESLAERGIVERNKYIRNLDNGYIFSTNIDEGLGGFIEEMGDISIRAIGELNLNFGAVDIIIGRIDDNPYILEVNTAPGLEGSTLQAYVDAFRAHLYN